MSKVFVTGHKSPDTDSIAAAISYSYLKRQLGMDAVAARAGEPNKETKFALDYFKEEAPVLLTNVARKSEEDEKTKLILVDHNESKQCVDGIKDAEVLELIDHHRLGDFETESPIFILIRPVGCVNTVIYGLYKQNGVKPSKEVAGMMLSAIISDTVLFRSPTCTEEDKKAVKELAEIAGVDYEKYGMDMLKAGADISDYPAEKLAHNDTKEFEAGGKTFSCGQISVMDVEPINAKKADIMKALEATKAEKNYEASYLMVTNILTEDTYLWFTEGAEAAAEKAFGKKAENGMVYLPKVMSRKKQVAPFLLKVYGE
ncbi:manganese-dependent inorganic pyrophosphatase [uncultured Dialister sp.]|jgi:manganese-dependent inorganic pyrophosphatase|uniref:manganese-dependent inorganic pyrophosphatase n=1 Tax=uncultured Dialister sp. TaxID=278064 RepID=UPI002636245C|nr:manganese-dependent inorganic pyrophosphatase [uncultured Dialister sp.]